MFLGKQMVAVGFLASAHGFASVFLVCKGISKKRKICCLVASWALC